jgi:hypothetical protein
MPPCLYVRRIGPISAAGGGVTFAAENGVFGGAVGVSRLGLLIDGL